MDPPNPPLFLSIPLSSQRCPKGCSDANYANARNVTLESSVVLS